jgi:integrase
VSEPRRPGLHAITGPPGGLARSAALMSGLAPVFAAATFDPADPVLAEVCSSSSRAVLRTGMLPVPMQREISWWVATCHANGERVIRTGEWNQWAAIAAGIAARRPEVRSFADLPLAEWMAAWVRAFHAAHGRLPAAGTRERAGAALGGMLPRLAVYYSDAPWWKHDLWCLRFDPRIPRRDHEPHGDASVRWDNIEPSWLREGVKFCTRLQLETGQLTWSTVMQVHVFAARFGEFALARGLGHPALTADPSQLRALALDFRAFLQRWRRDRPAHGRARGGPLDARSVARSQRFIGNFYRFMNDYQVDAAAATGDDRWLALTDSHARLYRIDELRAERAIRQADERNYISDADLARMLQYVELLGMPRDQSMTITRHGRAIDVAGFGQPAMMRAWLIQALTGRRAAEVLLMDFDPLTAIPGVDPAAVPDGGMVARLRYQQTKVDGAPSTILVGADVAEIVGEQQAWVREHWRLGPDGSVRYLFPKLAGNRKGTRAWETSHYDGMLRKLSGVLGLRDASGRPLSYSHSHRLRHTKATTLLNAGAPIHVVQRYLGHRSPEMSMRYAATLATTAEREFLAMARIGRDGRTIAMDGRDMLDVLQLDRRTDRVLPNGWCLLPPARSCDKGNACHGCDHFATDRSHLPEIRRQLAGTEQLIEHRKAQHLARYGEPMSEGNIWLEQRLAEVRSMRLEIAALEAQPGDASIIRGSGVCGRSGYQGKPVPVAITPGPGPS